MGLFPRKILCYVLVYDQVDIIKQSLDFITRLSDRLEIIVIENPSNNSPYIQEYIQGLGKKKMIKRYYQFNENITNNAYNTVLNKELGRIRKAPYVIVTDGDLVASSDSWLDLELEIMKDEKVFACGISLSLENLPVKSFPDAKSWIPNPTVSHDLYDEAKTGVHLLMFRGKDFSYFMKWKNKNSFPFIDDRLHLYCDEMKKRWARVREPQLRHLTWDLYSLSNNPYTIKKNKQSRNNLEA